MELNRELSEYSFDETEQAAFEAMQLAALDIAEKLMAKPRGTLADTGDGEVLFVCPWEGRLEIMVCEGYSEDRHGQITFVSAIEGQNAHYLDSLRGKWRAWLAAPKFLQASPADRMEQIVARVVAEHEGVIAEWLATRQLA